MQPHQLGMADWLYRNSDVASRVDNDDGSVTLSLRVTGGARAEIENRLRKL